MARVGVIGLGNMGGRIARRLLAGGEEVTGYDQSPAALEASGAAPAGSIGALAEAAEVVLLSLPDSPVVEAVVLGDGGCSHTAGPRRSWST